MDYSFLNYAEPVLISAFHIDEAACPVDSAGSYGRRTVKRFELDYITWGRGYIVTNGEKIDAIKGNLFFRTPGMVVEGLKPYHCCFITFDMFGEGAWPSDPSNPYMQGDDFNNTSEGISRLPAMIKIAADSGIETLFLKLVKEYTFPGSASRFITRSCLLRILYLMYEQWLINERNVKGSKSLKLSYGRIYTVKEYIMSNPHLNFTLDELADMSGFSRYFFCRIFKEIAGKSPIDFQIQCRVNEAKKMLAYTGKSIKEIIIDCGFENESYFFKLFKRNVGVTPSAFRQMAGTQVRHGNRTAVTAGT